MKETTKSNARRKDTWLFNKVFAGKGIDIGSGDDPFDKTDFPNVDTIEFFDLKDGNAQYILQHRSEESYDFVHSSNCLEHMDDAVCALRGWWYLVKLRGYLILTVPDEDLYEQGRFKARSRFNKEHKHSFTIHKKNSWCKWSLNILDMLEMLPDCQVIKIEQVDTNYDYNIPWGKKDQTMRGAETFIEVVLKKIINYGL